MRPRPYQQRGLDDIRAALSGVARPSHRHRVGHSGRSKRVLYVLPTGGGKCLGAGTPVMLHSGHICPVEFIKAGDKIMGPDGLPRTVVATAKGREQLYRVTPVKGDAYVVNESHILSLYNQRSTYIRNICVLEYIRQSANWRGRHKGWRVPGILTGDRTPELVGIKVEPIGEGDYYGFELSGPDRLFLLGDFTVTHNTAIYAWIAQGAASKGKRILVLEHRKELIKQAGVALARVGVRHRIIAPPDKIAYCRREQITDVGLSFISDRAEVAVASVQTLGRRMAWLAEFAPDIVIIDEAHHSVAGTWASIMAATDSAVHIGVTATPVRTNGQGLRESFQTMVLGPSVRDLIADGYLVPPKMLVPPSTASFDDVAIRNGDLDPEMQAEILNKREITGDAVKHYAQHTPGLPAIVFCCNRKHAHDVAAQFQEAGWRFHVIDGTMEGRERDDLIRGLVSGAVQGLVSVDLISEGTDIPVASVAIMLRRTLSEGLFLQMCGRVLRPVYASGFELDELEGRLLSIEASGKAHGWVLDHVNNYGRHGAPHTDREWSLEGVKRKRRVKQEDEEEREDSRQCPACYIVHDPAPVCPECGHVYAPKRAPLRVVDGSLVEIAASAQDRERLERMKRAKEQARDRHIAEARAEKDRLRRELREIAEQAGSPLTWREILDMKPKALREAINLLGGELFMRGVG